MHYIYIPFMRRRARFTKQNRSAKKNEQKTDSNETKNMFPNNTLFLISYYDSSFLSVVKFNVKSTLLARVLNEFNGLVDRLDIG